jgi:hypothetical protein
MNRIFYKKNIFRSRLHETESNTKKVKQNNKTKQKTEAEKK